MLSLSTMFKKDPGQFLYPKINAFPHGDVLISFAPLCSVRFSLQNTFSPQHRDLTHNELHDQGSEFKQPLQKGTIRLLLSPSRMNLPGPSSIRRAIPGSSRPWASPVLSSALPTPAAPSSLRDWCRTGGTSCRVFVPVPACASPLPGAAKAPVAPAQQHRCRAG